MKLEGAGLSERIVPETELEPFMPEDGDMVKLLLPDQSTEPGKVGVRVKNNMIQVSFFQYRGDAKY